MYFVSLQHRQNGLWSTDTSWNDSLFYRCSKGWEGDYCESRYRAPYLSCECCHMCHHFILLFRYCVHIWHKYVCMKSLCPVLISHSYYRLLRLTCSLLRHQTKKPHRNSLGCNLQEHMVHVFKLNNDLHV